MGLLDKAKSAVKRARGKNLGAWTMGYASWLARSSLPRARRALGGGPGRATCCSRSAITTSRSGARPPIARSVSRACEPGPRVSRAGVGSFATPTGGRRGTVLLSPARSTARLPRRPRRARAPGSAKSRCTCTTTATRRRRCATMIGQYLELFARARPPSRDPDGRLSLRVHPRQLVPRQRAAATAAGAASTRRCRCCSRPAATRTSRSRPRPTSPARQGQPDLLARRRSRAAAAPTSRGARARRASARRSHADDQGRWRWRCGPRRRAWPAARERRDHRQRSGHAGAHADLGRSEHPRRGRPEWVFVKVHTHGAPEPQAASLLGEGGARAAPASWRPATTTGGAGCCTT